VPARPATLAPAVLAGLVAAVGEANVLVDPALTRTYATDWTGRWQGTTDAVVRPGSTEEVARVLRLCHEFGVPVVPQGGNTGLAGGATPLEGELVLSLARLRGIEDADREMGQVTVGAGVTIASAAAVLAPDGWTLGVDLASRDSATVGGAVATDAGGLHVLRWGSMRRQVVGIEAVLADGSVVTRLSGLPKDNAGYSWPQVLAGSEGTLAVITRVRLGLVPVPAHRTSALLGLSSMADAVTVVGALRRHVPGLDLAEVMLADGVELVCEHHGWEPPLPDRPPVLLLVEAAGSEDPTDALGAGIEALPVRPTGVAVAQDSVARQRLVRYREGHTEAISAIGVPRKLDVSIPWAHLADVVAWVQEAVAAAGGRAVVFGHLGDASVHLNLLGLEGAPGDDVEDQVLRRVAAAGGSISAEHGIGRAKVRWLPLVRSDEDRRAMAAVRSALDPAGILNPGVLWPAPPG
jgi:FAD/FMN-containing dehydrogenase